MYHISLTQLIHPLGSYRAVGIMQLITTSIFFLNHPTLVIISEEHSLQIS